MAKRNQRKKVAKKKRLTKADIDKQRALKRMALSILTGIVLVFAALKLGVFGMTAYNVIRFMVGSLTISLYFCYGHSSFFFKWLQKKKVL
ncbi:hypothetical protein ABG807_11920 [Streptococcus iniae]